MREVHIPRFLMALLCLGLTSVANPVFAQNDDPIEGVNSQQLRSDYRYAPNYMKSILDQHEAQFPGAMRYDKIEYYTSLGRLSRIQQGVLAEFFKMPRFEKELSEREPLTDIEVTVKRAYSFKGQQLNLDGWNHYKEQLKGYLQYVVKDYEHHFGKTPDKSQLLEGLRNHMRATHWSQHEGWNDPVHALIHKMTTYIFVHSIYDANPELDIKGVYSELLSMGIGALDYLEEHLTYEPMLEHFAKDTGNDQLNRSEWLQLLPTAVHIYNDWFYNETLHEFDKGENISIREAHPNICIFRGYVGNDCSTSFSPGFVFTPFDRYYYVFDENGVSLGYVGLSVVYMGEQKALYLHTIQGPELNSKHTQLVMRAFQKAAPQMGAKAVLLSTDENIFRNVNFNEIRNTMAEAVQGKKFTPVTWVDQEYRNIIGQWESTMDYDDPKRNAAGRILTFKDDIIKIKTNQTPFTMDFTMPGSIEEPSFGELIRQRIKDCLSLFD